VPSPPLLAHIRLTFLTCSQVLPSPALAGIEMVKPPRIDSLGNANVMDWFFDYVSVGAFWTILLLGHALLSVALVGAISHQAATVLMKAQPQRSDAGITRRFASVRGPTYATAVCVLWLVTFILGAWIYTKYRIYVRVPIEEAGYWKTLGIFDLKEHLTAIGLAILPIYWSLWKEKQAKFNASIESARKGITLCLAGFCWYAFLVGHVLNNVRGFGI
jgi:hypothetical protein